MIVAAIKIFDVQRDTGTLGKALKPVFDQFGIPLAQSGRSEFRLEDKPWPAGNVERTSRQCFIHRRIGRSISRDPALFAQRLRKGFTDRDACIFGCMVLVDMEIADGFDRQIDQRMPGKLFKHMIKKADPCRNLVNPCSVKVEFDVDRRFIGLSTDGSRAHDARYNDPFPLRNVLTRAAPASTTRQ